MKSWICWGHSRRQRERLKPWLLAASAKLSSINCWRRRRSCRPWALCDCCRAWSSSSCWGWRWTVRPRRTGALRAHRADRADALGQSVFPSAPPAQELPRFHHLACRADVIVVRTSFRGAPRRIIFNASSTASLGRVCARDGGVGSASWFSDALAFAIKHPHVLIVSCWRTIQRSADRYVNEAPSGTAHQHQAPHCRWLDRCVDDAARGILLPADLALTRDPSQMTEAINFVADTLMFGGTAPLVAGALPAGGASLGPFSGRVPSLRNSHADLPVARSQSGTPP